MSQQAPDPLTPSKISPTSAIAPTQSSHAHQVPIPEAQPMNGSGISGQVMITPMRPIQRSGESNASPYEATITILNAAGETVAQVKSDAEGHFQINLEPGTYTLRPESPQVRPFAKPQTVTVSGTELVPVQINYDSGIR